MLKNLNKLSDNEIRNMLTKVLDRLQRTEVNLPDEGIVKLCGQSMFRGAFIDVEGKLRLTLLVHNAALEQCNGWLVKVTSFGELDHSDPSTVFVSITVCKYYADHLCDMEDPGHQIGFKSTLGTVKKEIDLAMAVLEEQINEINNIVITTPGNKDVKS